MSIPPEEGGLKEKINAENNIITSDSTLCIIIPLKLKNMTSQYKVMCGFECCIYSKIMHSSSLSWRENYLKYLRIKVVM